MKKLSHTDNEGKANMVDVGNKPDQIRIAKAEGSIHLRSETIALIKENTLKKGDVLAVARIAGIQAAKNTASLIPLCHTLLLSSVSVEFDIRKDNILVCTEVKCKGQTGVEMEALTSASVALLTIYDMCKAVDKEMLIGNVCLVNKQKI